MVQMAMAIGEQLRESANPRCWRCDIFKCPLFPDPDSLRRLISENGLTTTTTTATTTVAIKAWPQELQSGAKCERRFSGHRGCSAAPSLQLNHRAQSIKHMHAAPRKRASGAVLPASTWSDPMDALPCNNTVPGMELGAWSTGRCSSRSLCNPGLAHLGSLGPARL
jgi:hypothetical protein